MHSVLDIPELALEILSHLPIPDRLHLALTCRTLWCTSLPTLWVAVNGAALNGLIPSELRVYDSTPMMIPTSIPSLRTFIPLLKYGEYVRHLSVTDTFREPAIQGGHGFELEALVHAIRTSAAYTRPIALLPRMESLSVILSSHSSLGPAIRLLSPELSYLKLKVHLWQSAKPNKVALLVESITRCPSLTGLDIDVAAIGFPRDVLDAALGKVILSLRQLRLLRCRGSTSLLLAAAQCQGLERLVIDGYEFRHEDAPRDEEQSPTFPALVALGVNSIVPLSGSVVLSLLGTMSTPALAQLQLHIRGREAGLIEAVSEVIAHKWARSLTTLQLQFDVTPVEETLFGSIHPLFRCSHLRTVLLRSGSRLNLTDDMYHALSLSWPKLTALSIRSELKKSMVASPPRASCRALNTLAKNCKKMRYLCIPVDFDTLRGANADKQPQPSTSMRKMDACLSVCNFPRSTAEHLLGVFPGLKAMRCQDACLREVRELVCLPSECEEIDEQDMHDVRITFPFSTVE